MKTIDFHSLLDINSIDEPEKLPALNGCELQDLLNPLSCQEFVDTYFSQTSLNVKGTPEKFKHIFGWERLKHALARGQRIRDRRHNITASFAGGEDNGSKRRMFDAYHNQVGELLNAGATVCITNIHMADPFLAQWSQAIRTQLNFTGTVGVNCYISPDGAGLPMHYDKRVATSIQIVGKKRWRYSTKSAKPWPDDNGIYQQGVTESSGEDLGKLPNELDFQEVELNAGDLLCLPAGAWHSARGIGVSLALNLYFSPRNFLDQLTPLLQDFAFSSEQWRGGPPPTVEDIHGDMPNSVTSYIRERLEEFHKLVLESLEGPDALTGPWLNSLTFKPYTGWQPTAKLDIPDISPTQRFTIEKNLFRFITSQDKVIIPCDHGILTFPASFAPTLENMASAANGFSIPEALSWQQQLNGPPTNEAMSYMKMLFKNRLIKMM